MKPWGFGEMSMMMEPWGFGEMSMMMEPWGFGETSMMMEPWGFEEPEGNQNKKCLYIIDKIYYYLLANTINLLRDKCISFMNTYNQRSEKIGIIIERVKRCNRLAKALR